MALHHQRAHLVVVYQRSGKPRRSRTVAVQVPTDLNIWLLENTESGGKVADGCTAVGRTMEDVAAEDCLPEVEVDAERRI